MLPIRDHRVSYYSLAVLCVMLGWTRVASAQATNASPDASVVTTTDVVSNDASAITMPTTAPSSTQSPSTQGSEGPEFSPIRDPEEERRMLAARSESTVRTEPSGNGAPANTPDDRVTGVVVGSLVNVGLAGLLAGLTYTALPALIGGAGGERSRLALLVSDITINVIAELVALPAVYTLILSRMGGTGTYRGAFLGNLAGFVAGLALLPLVAISAGPSSRRESSWIVYGIAAPVIVFTGMSIGYEISSSPQPTTATTATTRERASPRAQIFPGIQLNNSIQGLTLSGTF